MVGGVLTRRTSKSVFPLLGTIHVIEGGTVLRAHGGPLLRWGAASTAENLERIGIHGSVSATRGRIFSLALCHEEIQEQLCARWSKSSALDRSGVALTGRNRFGTCSQLPGNARSGPEWDWVQGLPCGISVNFAAAASARCSGGAAPTPRQRFALVSTPK